MRGARPRPMVPTREENETNSKRERVPSMNNFITKLSLRGKFLLITAGMLVPILALSVIAVRLELEKIQVARAEDTGLDWASDLIVIASNLSEYREHAIAVAGGAEGERGEMTDHRGFVGAAADRLDERMKSGDEVFINAS